jgi:transposase
MNKQFNTIGIGIDVSKAKLDIALLNNEGEVKYFVVPNNKNGIHKIINKIKGYSGKIILESTGRYHLLSAIYLSKASFDVRVINPLIAHKFMRAGIRKNKTDKIDAYKLAEIAIIEKNLPKPFKADKVSIQIRQKIGLISSMEREIQSLKGIYNSYKEFQIKLKLESSDAEEKIMDSIKNLADAKAKLEREIETMIIEKIDNQKKHDVLTSIPGISPYAASLILQFFSEDYNKSAKQWIAYAGMDVSVKQSGTWRGRGKLSKRGNAYLRKRLYSAAWGATMNNDNFRKYYDQLKEDGRKHVEALTIIARKLIRISFVLLQKNKYYDEQLCFSS